MKAARKTTSTPRRSKTGRTQNFSPKQLAGLPLGEVEIIARLGDKTGTGGAKLVRELRIAYILSRLPKDNGARQRFTEFSEQLTAATLKGDKVLLREVADAIAAERDAGTKGAYSPALSFAASYVQFCQSFDTLPDDVAEEMKAIPSFLAAMRRGPSTPTIPQVYAHLEQIMGQAAPDRKTVSRWAKSILGITPRPRRANRDMGNSRGLRALIS